MTELVRIHKRKLVLGLIILALFVGLKLLGGHKAPETPAPTESTEEAPPTERNAATVTFGSWAPTEYRTVLGQSSKPTTWI